MTIMKKHHPVVVDFQLGNITADEALESLGREIATARQKGAPTEPLMEAVSQILGMNEEPDQEDTEQAAMWEKVRSEG